MNVNRQQTVLTGLIHHGKAAWEEVSSLLHDELFTGEYAEVYATIKNLHRAGKLVDTVSVFESVSPEFQELVRAIGERGWCRADEIASHIADLQKTYSENRARDIGAMLLESGDYETARKELDRIGDTSAKAETVDGKTALKRLWDDVEAKADQDTIGLSTGLTKLDELLGGMVEGDFILLAGRPSMGKTALALNIAQHAACPVGVFSLEMPTTKLMARLVSAQGIDHGKLKHPKTLTDDDWNQLVSASAKIKQDLYINDIGGLSLVALESEARRMVKKHNCGLIVIDYLQLITHTAEKRHEVVAEISRRLKALAKNLRVPVIALSQLNRQMEGVVNPVPNLAMLRESGQLEQDADVVLFVDRPEQRHSDTRPGEADLIVAKNRDGQTGTAVVAWQGQYQRFVNLSHNWYPGRAA